MSKRFFRLSDDVSVPHRWHLAMPRDSQGHEFDDWQLRRGIPVSIGGHLKFPVEIAGKALDFTEAGLGTPVVHVRIASLFSELAPGDVQLFPVEVEGQPDQYVMLVAVHLIRCIDEEASRIRWRVEEGVAPHKAGPYASVRNLRIDKAKVGSARVFRPEGFHVALIVSEPIKDALEKMNATGTKFEEV